MADSTVPSGLVNIATIVLGIALIVDFVWVINTALHAMK
jgi:hypothetical protein